MTMKRRSAFIRHPASSIRHPVSGIRHPVTAPVLGITMGDPSGIGPEIILRTLIDRKVMAAARALIFGDAVVFDRVGTALGIRVPKWRELRPGEPVPPERGPFLLQFGPCPERLALKGRPTAEGGTAAATWIEAAVAYALKKRVAGIVTAPISKEALHKAGLHWPGHTEMIAAMTETPKPVMMMAGGGLRIALVTTHLAMRDLPKAVTKDEVLATIRITAADLHRRFGIRRPRIGVCGLNPHAGEKGIFGRKEIEAITPAIAQARRLKIACDGPIPGDIAFVPAVRAKYDALVAMYHDQATIPVKMLAFDSGVNITLGLPIIRTSPDHGTAYDIVKKGVANPGSMIAAVLTAAEMAGRGR